MGLESFLKNGLNYKLRDDLQNSHIESVWLEIFVFKTKSILFGCYYRPPESSKYFSDDLDQLITEQLETVNCLNKGVIIMGDFDINYLSNAANINVKKAFNNLGLTQIIKTATRITEDSSTSIDLSLQTKRLMLRMRHLSLCPSVIMIWLVVWRKSTPANTIQEQSNVLTANNHNDLCNDTKNINWKPIEEASEVNKAFRYFNTKVSKIFDRHEPTIQKNVKGRPCKWLTK